MGTITVATLCQFITLIYYLDTPIGTLHATMIHPASLILLSIRFHIFLRGCIDRNRK